MFELVGCNGTSIVLEMSGFRQGIPQSYERRPDCSNDNFDRLASEPQLTLIGGNDTRSKISMIVLGRDRVREAFKERAYAIPNEGQHNSATEGEVLVQRDQKRKWRS